MDIVITVNTYYPLTDGVQAVTQYEAEGLVKLGNNVTVVTVRYPGLKEFEVYNGVKIIRYNISTKHALYVGDIKGYRELITNLCLKADALINVSTQTATTETLYPILNTIKCKKILHMHGFHDFKWHLFDFSTISTFSHKLWNNLRWYYDYKKNRKYLKLYDSVIQLHEMDPANIYFKKYLKITSKIINNGADNSFFSLSRNNYTNNFGRYALCVSNYIPRKNQEFLLKAFYLSKKTDLSLLLIGSEKTSYYEKLLKLKTKLDKKYGKRKVYIMTNIKRDQIPFYVSNASIFLLGSTWEAFPISIVETMASGTPFISTDVGIVKYLPGGKVINSILEMSFWINTLADETTIAHEIGLTGRKFAEKHFSEQRNVRSLERILKGN